MSEVNTLEFGKFLAVDEPVPFGPTGETVYKRTYSRTKPNGEKETWPETVHRVVTGNLSLVYGHPMGWPPEVCSEYDQLVRYMRDFAILPAGRHLWASGVKGRQYLFNCHVAGWGEKLSRHFEFTFMRLMEGGGVGANYSSRFLQPYGTPRRQLNVHIVCDPSHPDYEDMKADGVLSDAFSYEWEGAFPVEDSREGWADALVDLIDTFMTDDEVKHADRVYDVSRVRGKGQPLRTFGGTASGPQPFAVMMHEVGRVLTGANGRWLSARAHLTPVEAMEIDHAIAECVVSGGNRRSARMAICHWNDPHIMDFINCKKDSGKHWTTNISVEVDDEFTAHINDEVAGPVERRELAYDVHEAVVTGMLTNGEPGYWNSSLSNEGEVGCVIATNPCGEIALEAWEPCNLGHVNLDYFAPKPGVRSKPDILGLLRAHHLMTRFLIRATYGDVNDTEQADRLAKNRRIGVGHFGVQGFFAKQGIPYSKVPNDVSAVRLLRELHAEVTKAARQYAFELRIPEPVKTTTVAPTGTIAKLPGVTEGIHPIYARHFLRRIRFSIADPDQAAQVQGYYDQGFEVETDVYDKSGNTVVVTFPTKDKLVAEVEELGLDPEIVESADELSVDEMLAFQRLYQSCYADNAVSFTVNVEAEPHQAAAMADGLAVPTPSLQRVEEVGQVLAEYLPVLKGTTLMVDGTRPQAPYERITASQFAQYEAIRVEDGTDEECASGACPVR